MAEADDSRYVREQLDALNATYKDLNEKLGDSSISQQEFDSQFQAAAEGVAAAVGDRILPDGLQDSSATTSEEREAIEQQKAQAYEAFMVREALAIIREIRKNQDNPELVEKLAAELNMIADVTPQNFTGGGLLEAVKEVREEISISHESTAEIRNALADLDAFAAELDAAIRIEHPPEIQAALADLDDFIAEIETPVYAEYSEELRQELVDLDDFASELGDLPSVAREDQQQTLGDNDLFDMIDQVIEDQGYDINAVAEDMPDRDDLFDMINQILDEHGIDRTINVAENSVAQDDLFDMIDQIIADQGYERDFGALNEAQQTHLDGIEDDVQRETIKESMRQGNAQDRFLNDLISAGVVEESDIKSMQQIRDSLSKYDLTQAEAREYVATEQVQRSVNHGMMDPVSDNFAKNAAMLGISEENIKALQEGGEVNLSSLGVSTKLDSPQALTMREHYEIKYKGEVKTGESQRPDSSPASHAQNAQERGGQGGGRGGA